jgi:hypothetical protein
VRSEENNGRDKKEKKNKIREMIETTPMIETPKLSKRILILEKWRYQNWYH